MEQWEEVRFIFFSKEVVILILIMMVLLVKMTEDERVLYPFEDHYCDMASHYTVGKSYGGGGSLGWGDEDAVTCVCVCVCV